jgi:hypothetical protein
MNFITDLIIVSSILTEKNDFQRQNEKKLLHGLSALNCSRVNVLSFYAVTLNRRRLELSHGIEMDYRESPTELH